MIWPVSKTDDRQLHHKGFKIIFHLDIAFGNQFISVVKIAQADLGGRLGVIAAVNDIADDDIIGGDENVDCEGFSFAEFVMLYGVLYQGLEGDRRDEVVFGGEVGYFDRHADGVGEANFQQVEIIADEFYFFSEEDEVTFFVAEDIAVDPGEGIVVEPGIFRVAGDEEGKGIEGIEDKVGIDLVLEGFELGLGLGDVELFHAGFVVFFFEVEEEDLIYIGDEAGGDYDHQYGIDQVLIFCL
jgi:hypothetical protein